MSTDTTTAPGTEVDLAVSKAITKIAEGPVKMADLLAVLAPSPAAIAPPAKLPVPAAIKDTERKALERLPEVFGRVVPTERRALEPLEVTALVEEKQTLDEIEKMAKKRKESIRTTVYNHFDVEAEQHPLFDPETVLRDKDGHYVTAQTAEVAPGTAQTFKRETRGGSPSLSEADLKALVDNPDFPDFTHEDYLAMTEQVRTVNENKFMLHLQKKPGLLRAIATVTKPGAKTSALNLRATE